MKFKQTKKSVEKTKKVQKEKKTGEFPKIFRFITENKFLKQLLASIDQLTRYLDSRPILKKLTFITSVLFVSLLIILVITGMLSFYQNIQVFQTQSLKRQEVTQSIKLWQSIADKYPGYKDAYFKIASMEYQIGDYMNAKLNVDRALSLDPNFQDAKTLERLIDLNY